MRLEVGANGHYQPLGVVKFWNFRQRRRFSQGGVSGENPDEIVFFLDGIAAGLGAGKFLLRRKVGNADAIPFSIKLPAVIRTSEVWPVDLALMEGNPFVRAGVF